MKLFILLFCFIAFSITLIGQNVGIGVAAPAAKLHIKGTSNITQLIIDANSTQGNLNPLIILRNSNGTNLMWIHSDHLSNSFIGVNSGRVNDTTSSPGAGRFNTFIGSSAGYSNTSGTGGTAIGYQSLYSNNTGNHNTANGVYSLFSNTSGSGNTAFGVQALYLNTTGTLNTAAGELSLYKNSVGISNTANGYGALQSNDNGNYNTAMGVVALLTNNSGSDNTALGVGSLYNNTSGSNNTAIGFHALVNNTEGSQNIAIGANSGTISWATNISNTIGIGNDDLLHGSSNQVLIGNTSMVSIGGHVNWGVYSDARIKNNILDDVPGLSFILKLRPVTYHISTKSIAKITGNKETPDFPGKYDAEKIKRSGFLAQEVEKAAKASGYDFSGYTAPKNQGELYTIRYAEFVVPLVKAMQEQQVLIEKLTKQVDQMEILSIVGKQQGIIDEQNRKIELLVKEIELLKIK
jgi:hypothetical protein